MNTDKEAIIERLFLNRWATLDMRSIEYFLKDGTISGYFRTALNEAMDTYAASLLKEMDELTRDVLYWKLEAQAKHNEITQLQKDNEYWKQLAQAAEPLIRVETLCDLPLYNKYQQLKTQPPDREAK